jgi:hypothetical protein
MQRRTIAPLIYEIGNESLQFDKIMLSIRDLRAMIKDVEKELQIQIIDEINYYEMDFTYRTRIDAQYEKEYTDWKKTLKDERKRKKHIWKEKKEMGVLDHEQREKDLHYHGEYLLDMGDSLKDDIRSVTIRKYDLDFYLIMN